MADLKTLSALSNKITGAPPVAPHRLPMRTRACSAGLHARAALTLFGGADGQKRWINRQEAYSLEVTPDYRFSRISGRQRSGSRAVDRILHECHDREIKPQGVSEVYQPRAIPERLSL